MRKHRINMARATCKVVTLFSIANSIIFGGAFIARYYEYPDWEYLMAIGGLAFTIWFVIRGEHFIKQLPDEDMPKYLICLRCYHRFGAIVGTPCDECEGDTMLFKEWEELIREG